MSWRLRLELSLKGAVSAIEHGPLFSGSQPITMTLPLSVRHLRFSGLCIVLQFVRHGTAFLHMPVGRCTRLSPAPPSRIEDADADADADAQHRRWRRRFH